ncbi:MAG: hypothetical protein AAGF90_22820, partial [Pseudomonadota bacterium]
MMIVIVTGGYGVFAYLRYPKMMSENLLGQSASALRREMGDLDVRIQRLTQRLPDSFAAAARDSLDNTKVGGGFLKLIGGSSRACGSARGRDLARAEADKLADPEQQIVATEMVSALSRKAEIASRLRRDLQYKALMDVWLWLHVPLTIGLIAALVAHVVIVFFYW